MSVAPGPPGAEEGNVGIVPMHRGKDGSEDPNAVECSSELLRLAAGGVMVAGGLLLLSRQRRTGTLLSVAGAGLALADQKDAVRTWWNNIPEYVERVQGVISQVQNKVDEFTAKRESFHRVLTGEKQP